MSAIYGHGVVELKYEYVVPDMLDLDDAEYKLQPSTKILGDVGESSQGSMWGIRLDVFSIVSRIQDQRWNGIGAIPKGQYGHRKIAQKTFENFLPKVSGPFMFQKAKRVRGSRRQK